MQKDTEHLTWLMVGSALAAFCCIIAWHLYTYVITIHNTLDKLKLFPKSHRRRRADNGAEQDCGSPVATLSARQPAPTTSVIDMQEPLLTDNKS